MAFYRTAQICLNGHMINDAFDKDPELNKNYCPHCGAKTITQCPSCGAKINGYYDCEFAIIGDTTPVNSYCHNCGQPYPWTKSAIESAALVIQEESELSEQVKTSLIESLPDIVSETPKTNLAVVRIKKVFMTAGKSFGL